jgi:hypothetical protein
VKLAAVPRWPFALKTAVAIATPNTPPKRCIVLFAPDALPMSAGMTPPSAAADGTDGPPVVIQLDTDDEPIVVEAGGGSVTARLGRAEDPDLVLSGPAQPVGRLMLGRIDLAEARARGVDCRGDVALLERLTVRPPEGARAVAPAGAGGTR